MRDLSNDELSLYEYSSEFNLLRTRKEMIEFAVEYMTNELMTFKELEPQLAQELAAAHKFMCLC